jgi:hypothetical protein
MIKNNNFMGRGFFVVCGGFRFPDCLIVIVSGPFFLGSSHSQYVVDITGVAACQITYSIDHQSSQHIITTKRRHNNNNNNNNNIPFHHHGDGDEDDTADLPYTLFIYGVYHFLHFRSRRSTESHATPNYLRLPQQATMDAAFFATTEIQEELLQIQ